MAFGYTAPSFATSSKRPIRRCAVRATTSNAADTSTDGSGVNINKYKSQRSLISTDKREISAEEVNALMVKAGKKVRPQTFATQLKYNLSQRPLRNATLTSLD